jgi:Zn-dependent protease with chaperone function
LALALLLGAITVASALPTRLTRLHQSQIPPRLLITGWILACTGVLVAITGAVALLLLPDHGSPASAARMLGACWESLRHGGVSTHTDEATGVLAGATIAVLTARATVIGWRQAARRRQVRRERIRLLRLAARVEPGPPEVLWLAHDRPLAFSMPGHPGLLVATDGLTRHLSPGQTVAVLEHERAHLRGRHHLLVNLVDLLRETLPMLALFRAAPTALRELVELAADAHAARRCGPGTVRDALVAMTDDISPPAALAFARDEVDSRLSRLTTATETRWCARWAVGGGIICGAPLLPFLAAAGYLTILATLFC